MWQLPPLDFLLPFHHDAMPPQEYFVPDLGFSPTPSDSSTISGDSEPSPAPEFTHVVCNAPLVAPVPLPYHSPTFLRYEDLPDEDEDLSHPPYTRRPQKRKREDAGVDLQDSVPPTKRRSIVADFSRLQCGSRHPLARNVQVRGPPASGLRQGRPR
ncbi:predicted protein [Sparassis crispa]|uniref:Uncharacterized protein n=1 Tax=Sparassis crispa TaxID=139825 RepID=A0A401GJM6_9APHY|nr:predicted protein [Sparassis crispa]GBE82360.1 predicted protein [Sparassis crispa]